MFQDVQRVGLGEGPVGEGELSQVAEEQVDYGECLCGEERADVDADSRRAPILVPEERAPAAASEIDDTIAGPWREEVAEHVVANLRSEKRR